jgi:DNA repair exonuclease SbcCD ATPase subunit
MKFADLKIKNFLAITDATLSLADRGLVLIQGVNHDDSSADSNGTGKSSLFDALNWVLYGETARGASGDGVVNDTAGKDTEVQVDILDGDDVYRITRYRKHSKGKNSLKVLHLAKDGTITDHTKGTEKLTQEVVTKIIGASHDVFKAIYAGQERMPDLPGMTDKALKVLIEEAAGVTVLEAAYKEARDRVAAAKMVSETVERGLERVRDRRANLDDHKTQAEGRRDAWTSQQKQEIADGKVNVQTYVAEVKNLDAQMAQIDHNKVTDDIAECDRKLQSLSGEQQQQRVLSAAVTQAQSRLSLIHGVLGAIQERHKRQKAERDDLQHKVGCPCDSCGRPLTSAEMGAAVSAAGAKLSSLSTEFANKKKEFLEAQKQAQEASEALQHFEASMTDPSATSAQRASLQAQIDTYNALANKRTRVFNSAKTLSDQLKKLAAAANPHLAAIAECDRKIADADKELAELDQKLREAEAKVATAETVAKIFSPAGVRAHILDEVTPYLNQQTAKYLSTLSDDNITATWTTLVRNTKGEFKEKFSIEVVNDQGAKLFNGLSGGEKRKVRLATALALQDLIATRATKPIELFIGDEIDDALDAAGLERLMQILEEKARERGSVFVISHRSLRDWISQVVMVEKKSGATTLTESVS